MTGQTGTVSEVNMRLTLFLEHQCNLRCTYCYNGRKFARPMDIEMARGAVDMMLDMPRPLVQVGFFGGEPALRFDLIQEVTRYVRQRTSQRDKPIIMVLTTNGTLLVDERLEWLKENDFHMGLSIDGCQPAHDACRIYGDGRGSHADVDRVARSIQAHGLPLKTISVVDPANVDHLPDSLDYLLDLGIHHMSFNINYEGNWDDAARERFHKALEAFTDRFIQAYRDGRTMRVNLLDSKIVTHVKMGFACSDRCDFGCEEIAVAPSGRLYPCDRLIGEDDRDDVIIGTVRDGVDLAARDALIARKNAVLDECNDCDLQPRCMHWCGCVNYAMTGSVGEVSGLLCWFEQTLIDAADRAANTLFAEKNPGFLKRFYRFAL